MKKLTLIVAVAVLVSLSASPAGALLGRSAASDEYSSSVSTGAYGFKWTLNSLSSGTGGLFTSTGTLTGSLLSVSSATATTGSLLTLIADNTILTSGHYIRALGGESADTEVFTISEDGATAITSAVATTNSLSILNNAATTGDLITLTADSDNFTTGGYYLRALGGASSTTEVFSLAPGGVTAITQIATSGVGLTVTRDLASTSTANEVAAIVQTNASDDMAALTIKQDGTGNQITFDEDGATVLAIASTGVMTLGDGGTIDGITGTDVMNLTETTIRATGAFDVTGASTFGGGYGATGSTLAADGTANFDSTVTVGKVSPASAGSVVILGTTSGGITLTPIAAGTNTTTLINQSGGSAKDITLPSATCTLPGLGLANIWSASQAFDAGITVDTTNFTVSGTTGAAVSAAGIQGLTLTSTGATTADNVVCTNAATFGGGYGNTGATIATTGIGQFNGALTTDSTLTSGVNGTSTGGIIVNGSTNGGITITPIASGTGQTTIQNSAGTPTITLPATTCTLPGVGLANAFTAANTFTGTGITDAEKIMVYGNAAQTTTALTNDLIGVRGNARIDVDSANGKAMGGYFIAGNTTYGFNAEEVRGVYCGTVTKTPTAANKTWTNCKGIEIVTGNTATGATFYTDVTNLYGVRLKIGSSTGSGGNVCGDITNGYGVWVDHEQQGQACRLLDAGFYLSATNISGGTKAWDYGIDLSGVGANIGTADIRLSQGETITNTTDGVINLTATTIKATGLFNATGKATFDGEVKANQVTEDKLYWCDEFMEAAAVLASTVYSKCHWTGGGTNGTQTITAGPGGLMALSTTATGDRTSTLTFTTANFDAADLPIWEARVKMSNITNATMDIGMYVDANDEILFRFDSTTNAANIYLVTESNNAGEIVTDTTVDLVGGVYATFRIEWLTATTFKVYINGTEVLATHTSNVIRSLATFKPYFYVDNNSAAEEKILSIDYVKVWQDRDE